LQYLYYPGSSALPSAVMMYSLRIVVEALTLPADCPIL